LLERAQSRIDSWRLRLSSAGEPRESGAPDGRCVPGRSPLTPESTSTPRGREAVRDVLRNRNFRLLLVGQLLSEVGSQSLLVVVLTLVSGFSTSAVAISIPAVLSAVPRLAFGLVGGVMADRWNRKRTIVGADLLRALIVPVLLFVRTAEQLWLLYAVAGALALVAAFFYPARNAVVPQLVPPEHLLAANGLIQGSYVFALIVGSALAALALDFWIPLALFVTSAAYLASVLCVSAVPIPGMLARSGATTGTAVWEDMRGGLRFIRGHPLLIRVLAVAGGATLGLGTIAALAVPHLKGELGGGGLEFGMAMGMLGVGSVLGALLAGLLSRQVSTGSMVSGMLLLAGGAIAAFAYAESYAVVLASVAVVGACVVIARGALDALSQALSPDEMCGRVQAAISVLVIGGMAMAEGLSGILGDLLTVKAVIVAAGLITGLTGVGAMLILHGKAGIVAAARAR
jgi:DHA3 family macrolide efflux protein-like MFS transporter